MVHLTRRQDAAPPRGSDCFESSPTVKDDCLGLAEVARGAAVELHFGKMRQDSGYLGRSTEPVAGEKHHLPEIAEHGLGSEARHEVGRLPPGKSANEPLQRANLLQRTRVVVAHRPRGGVEGDGHSGNGGWLRS